MRMGRPGGPGLARLPQRSWHTATHDLVRLRPHLDGSALRRRYEAAKLSPLRFHDLRHAFGSLPSTADPGGEVTAG